MKRKKWKSKEKLEIVLEGLKNQCSVAELCNRYGIKQSMYYKWRDQLGLSQNAILSKSAMLQNGLDGEFLA